MPEKTCALCFTNDPACGGCRQKVDKLSADHRIIILYVGMIQAFIAFISVKTQFRQPVVLITPICRLWLHVLVGFRNDHTETAFSASLKVYRYLPPLIRFFLNTAFLVSQQSYHT